MQDDPSPEQVRTPFWTAERIMKLAVMLFVVNLIATTADLAIRQFQTDEVARYVDKIDRNSAELCRIEIALEVNTGENCAQPNVLQYFDPNEQNSDFRTRLSYVLCFVAQQAGANLETACG